MLKVDKAIADGEEAQTVSRSGRTILKVGKGRISLSDTRGKLTAAGRHYYAQTGKSHSKAFDTNAPLISKGSKQFIRMRDGSVKLARSWIPSDSEYKYTRLGKSYFIGSY